MTRALKPIDSTFFRSASALFSSLDAVICSIASLTGLLGVRATAGFAVAVLVFAAFVGAALGPATLAGGCALSFGGSRRAGAEDEAPPTAGAEDIAGVAGAAGAGCNLRLGLGAVVSE